VADAIDVIEDMVNICDELPRWKMKIVRWLWPELLAVIKKLSEYCHNYI
jgi:hypothetical protein